MNASHSHLGEIFSSHISAAVAPDRATCCPRCRSIKSTGFTLCRPCTTQEQAHAHIDATGFAVYALSTGQTARNMHDYKNSRVHPSTRDRAAHMVNTLLWDSLVSHWQCLTYMVGVRVDALTVVPSLTTTRHLSGEHALAPMVRAVSEHLGIARVNLAAQAAHNVDHRALQPEAFSIDTGTVQDRHVLIVDDTWTSGAHMSSVALMLRNKKATHVSTFAIARWVNTHFPLTQELVTHIEALQGRLPQQWCPWTLTGICPT